MFNYRLDATLCSRILRDLRDGPLHRASRTSTTVEDPLPYRVHVCNQAIRGIAKEIAQLVDLKFGPGTLSTTRVHSKQGHPKAWLLWRSQCGRIEAGADWSRDRVILVAY